MVVYHLSAPARRKKLERRLARHGLRKHTGCFDLDVTREQMAGLITDLKSWQWESGDSLRIISLCRRCERHVWYIGLPPQRPPAGWLFIEGEARSL